MRRVRLFSYVVEHDKGFAPNPFFNVCTLACCKPDIRRAAKVGDYILGTGAARPKLNGYACYWMRVSEIITFDQYWNDPRFRCKRPNMNASRFLQYGDNIYHREIEGGPFAQEYSFHSLPNGRPSKKNLQHDTGKTELVLIGEEFTYWGRSGPRLPDSLQFIVKKGPSHKCRFTDEEVAQFVGWTRGVAERGYVDQPAAWQFLARRRRRRVAPLAVRQ